MFQKLCSIISISIAMTTAFSANAEAIVVLSQNQADYVQTETGYVLHFELEATAEELMHIQDQVNGIADRVILEAVFVSEGKYMVTYTIDHQNQPEYVFKMMLVSGFQVINYKGSPYPLKKIVEVLYAFQEE
jgi:hypothetical protein